MASFIVLIILAIAVGFAVKKMIADHKSGRSCCGCSGGTCGNCPGAESKKS